MSLSLCLSLQTASAHHNKIPGTDLDVPFCGDGVIEQRDPYIHPPYERDGQFKGEYQVPSENEEHTCWWDNDIWEPCNPWNEDEIYTIKAGDVCGYNEFYQSNERCTNNGCKPIAPELEATPPRVEVNGNDFSDTDVIHVTLYDPGNLSSDVGHKAFLVQHMPDGSKHYIVNFCGGYCDDPTGYGDDQYWHGIYTEHGKGTAYGFSNYEPKDDYILETSFSITEPGTYHVEFLSEFFGRIAGPPFTICADPSECAQPAGWKGRIIDQKENGLPVPDLQLVLTGKDKNGNEFEEAARTDEKGNFEFPPIEYDEDTLVRLKVMFIRYEGNRVSFTIRDGRFDNPATAYATTKRLYYDTLLDKDFYLSESQRFESLNKEETWHNLANVHNLEDFARTHYYMAEAMRFAEEELGVDVNYQGSLTIILHAKDEGVFYRIKDHEIHIQDAWGESSWDDRERPDNTDWHEFGHALMKASDIGHQNGWPKSHHGILSWNHLGRANPSTTDSWTEGFATWFSAVLANELLWNVMHDREDKPWLYKLGNKSVYNLEDDFKSWDSLGRKEDIAAAALLWDLYDNAATYGGGQSDDDKISFDINEMWNLLNKTEMRDMKDVYDVMVSKYGEGSIGHKHIDEIFIAHGFFVDENGNFRHDEGEEVGRAAYGVGWRSIFDLNNSGIYDIWDGNPIKPGEWIMLDTENDHHWGSNNPDFDDHSVYDLTGDGFANLTENPFYIYPNEERRSTKVFPEELIHIQAQNIMGNLIYGGELTVSYEYNPPLQSRNFSYTVPIAEEEAIGLWVPENAKVVLTLSSAGVPSQSITIHADQFRENIKQGRNQGEHKLMLGATEVIPFVRQSFSDVPEGHEYYDAIEYVKAEGIVVGYEDGTYRPGQLINRAEFTKIIMAALYPSIGGGACFPDVKQEWFAKFICFAKDKGVVSGYPDGQFKPAQNISFVEAAKIIVNSFAFETKAGGDWYRPFVTALEERFAIPMAIDRLDKKITRGEMAEIIYRLRAKITNRESRRGL